MRQKHKVEDPGMIYSSARVFNNVHEIIAFVQCVPSVDGCKFRDVSNSVFWQVRGFRQFVFKFGGRASGQIPGINIVS